MHCTILTVLYNLYKKFVFKKTYTSPKNTVKMQNLHIWYFVSDKTPFELILQNLIQSDEFESKILNKNCNMNKNISDNLYLPKPSPGHLF